mmetsp:Transcript_53688/g.89066  ORF Transcript_53688/g.89066 Transcript_53688/m.89066 type:complete len:228 (+) Transcript_53688:116-799(+)
MIRCAIRDRVSGHGDRLRLRCTIVAVQTHIYTHLMITDMLSISRVVIRTYDVVLVINRRLINVIIIIIHAFLIEFAAFFGKYRHWIACRLLLECLRRLLHWNANMWHLLLDERGDKIALRLRQTIENIDKFLLLCAIEFMFMVMLQRTIQFEDGIDARQIQHQRQQQCHGHENRHKRFLGIASKMNHRKITNEQNETECLHVVDAVMFERLQRHMKKQEKNQDNAEC